MLNEMCSIVIRNPFQGTFIAPQRANVTTVLAAGPLTLAHEAKLFISEKATISFCGLVKLKSAAAFAIRI